MPQAWKTHNPQMEKFYKHKTLFNIEDNIFLDTFEDFLCNSNNYRLECSVKTDGYNIYPCRFHIYYSDDLMTHLQRAILFLWNMRQQEKININFDILQEIITLNEHNISDISSVVVWVDIREDISTSRCKIWMWIWEKNSQLFNCILQLYKKQNPNIDISGYFLTNTLLFWIDFWFNGSSRIKIYPCFKSYELHNDTILRNISSLFSEKIISYMMLTSQTNITFEKWTGKRMLHFVVEANTKELLESI